MYILADQRDRDPRGSGERYSAYLARNAARFPKRAFELATSEWYFNFFEHQCPHDAWLEHVRIDEPSEGERHEKRCVSLTITLLAAYHDGFIQFRYPRVHRYRILGASVPEGHGDWRYDEFRVTDDGLLEHEIEWSGPSPGDSWVIVADDVEFKWTPR